jgi:protein mago nashi
MGGDFYLRYLSKRGRGDFSEYELLDDLLKSSSYSRGDSNIRKQVVLSDAVLGQVRLMVEQSGITGEDDSAWPPPEAGRASDELEIKIDNIHLSFSCDADGAGRRDELAGQAAFHGLIRAIETLFSNLILLHHRVRAI